MGFSPPVFSLSLYRLFTSFLLMAPTVTTITCKCWLVAKLRTWFNFEESYRKYSKGWPLYSDWKCGAMICRLL